MVKSIPAQLSMWHLMTSEGSHSATSSPGSAAGPTPSASPDGPTTGLSGQDRARASRSRSQAKALVLTIQGTCGPTFIASSVPSGPLSSWESKLRERLAMVGSTEFALIWKEKATPAGAPISQLSRSTPRTFASGSIGSLKVWHTPTCHNAKEAGYPAEFTRNTISLTAEAHIATWPTPTKADGDGGHGMGTASVTGKRENGTKITVSLPGVVKIVSTWPTPTSVNRVRDEETLAKCAAFRLRNANQKTVPLYLGEVVANTVHSGQTPSGSPDQTGNRGALNPQFPCWLMGYLTVWDACAPTVMPSSRRSRQK